MGIPGDQGWHCFAFSGLRNHEGSLASNSASFQWVLKANPSSMGVQGGSSSCWESFKVSHGQWAWGTEDDVAAIFRKYSLSHHQRRKVRHEMHCTSFICHSICSAIYTYTEYHWVTNYFIFSCICNIMLKISMFTLCLPHVGKCVQSKNSISICSQGFTYLACSKCSSIYEIWRNNHLCNRTYHKAVIIHLYIFCAKFSVSCWFRLCLVYLWNLTLCLTQSRFSINI